LQTLKGSMFQKFNFGSHSFGQSVDVNDDVAIIGSDDTPINRNLNCGAAYIFKNKNGKWIEDQILPHADPLPNSFYGWSCSISEDKSTIVVGADDHDRSGKCAGAIYIYKKVGTLYELKQKLYPPILNNSMSYFGFSVDAKRDMVLVGAPVYRGSKDLKDGSVYLFSRDGVLQFKTRNMGKTFYGGNVKIAKDHYIVTAHREKSGVVYIYDEKFNMRQKISSVGSKTFGKSIAIHNNLLLVGAPLEKHGGAAYLYGYHNGGYVLIDDFTPEILNNKNCFGYNVDINKDRIVISDIESHNLEYENYIEDIDGYEGCVYIYDTSTRKLTNTIYTQHRGGGHCLKLNDSQLFEGNPNVNKNEGEVKIYDL
jgi:FG-GAP repeat